MEGADCDWWFGLNGRFARPYRGGSRQNLLTAAQVVIGSNYYPCYKLWYANRDCSRLVSRSRLMHDNALDSLAAPQQKSIHHAFRLNCGSAENGSHAKCRRCARLCE